MSSAPSLAAPAQQHLLAAGTPGNAERLSRISPFKYPHRTIVDICSRYPKMPLPNQFVDSTLDWPTNEATTQGMNLDTPINFVHDPARFIEVDPENNEDTPSTEPRTFVRAILLSGSPNGKVETDENGKETTPQHRTKGIRCLVGKKAAGGGLFAFGGQWIKGTHGKTANEAGYRKAMIDYTKKQCGVDLSKCKNWTKFMEFTYQREGGVTDKTLLYIPDVWNHLSSADSVSVQRTAQYVEVPVRPPIQPLKTEDEKKKEEEEAEKKPQTEKKLQTVTRALCVSLHGLLDYDPIYQPASWSSRSLEAHAEICMFAESLAEMISQQQGEIVAEYFVKKAAEKKELKRKRQEEAAAAAEAAAEAAAAKKRKLEEEAAEAAKKKEEEEAKKAENKDGEEGEKKDEEEKKEEEPKEEEKAEEKKEEEQPKEEKPKTKTVVTVDEEARAAFSWFDIPNPAPKGFIMRAQAEQVLHGIASRSHRQVEDLCAGVFEAADRLNYTHLTETRTEVPIEEE